MTDQEWAKWFAEKRRANRRLSRAFGLLCLLSLLGAAGLLACTEQERAKAWGGTANQDLPAGQKLVGMTWKESQLWILTRPMREGERPEEYQFYESSSWGLVEGRVVLKERK